MLPRPPSPCRYLRDVCGLLQLHSLSSGALVRALPLPGVGSVSGFSGSRKETELFFSFQSFAEPGELWVWGVNIGVRGYELWVNGWSDGSQQTS